MKTTETQTPDRLLKLPEVLGCFPVSRSRWYQGVKDGEFPKPVRLGPGAVAWRESDITRLIDSLATAE